jgi:hypothetical protein
MNQFLAIFNTRELALIFWLSVVIVLSIVPTKMRRQTFSLIKAFFAPKIFSVVVICWIYLAAIIFFASKLGWWNISMVKDSIIWTLAVIILLAKVVTKDSKRSLIEILKDTVQPIVLVEFITNVETLPLLLEIVLLPLLIFLYTGALIGKQKPEFETVVKLFNFLLVASGLFLLFYSVRYVVTNFNVIDKHQEGLNFFLPLWLTIAFMPCLYMIGLYSKYENVFVRINTRVAHRGNGIAQYFKRQLILKSGLSMKKLDQYDVKFRNSLIDSKEAVDKFFLSKNVEPYE